MQIPSGGAPGQDNQDNQQQPGGGVNQPQIGRDYYGDNYSTSDDDESSDHGGQRPVRGGGRAGTSQTFTIDDGGTDDGRSARSSGREHRPSRQDGPGRNNQQPGGGESDQPPPPQPIPLFRRKEVMATFHNTTSPTRRPAFNTKPGFDNFTLDLAMFRHEVVGWNKMAEDIKNERDSQKRQEALKEWEKKTRHVHALLDTDKRDRQKNLELIFGLKEPTEEEKRRIAHLGRNISRFNAKIVNLGLDAKRDLAVSLIEAANGNERNKDTVTKILQQEPFNFREGDAHDLYAFLVWSHKLQKETDGRVHDATLHRIFASLTGATGVTAAILGGTALGVGLTPPAPVAAPAAVPVDGGSAAGAAAEAGHVVTNPTIPGPSDVNIVPGDTIAQAHAAGVGTDAAAGATTSSADVANAAAGTDAAPIILGIIAGIFLLIMITFLAVTIYQRYKKKDHQIETTELPELEEELDRSQSRRSSIGTDTTSLRSLGSSTDRQRGVDVGTQTNTVDAEVQTEDSEDRASQVSDSGEESQDGWQRGLKALSDRIDALAEVIERGGGDSEIGQDDDGQVPVYRPHYFAQDNDGQDPTQQRLHQLQTELDNKERALRNALDEINGMRQVNQGQEYGTQTEDNSGFQPGGGNDNRGYSDGTSAMQKEIQELRELFNNHGQHLDELRARIIAARTGERANNYSTSDDDESSDHGGQRPVRGGGRAGTSQTFTIDDGMSPGEQISQRRLLEELARRDARIDGLQHEISRIMSQLGQMRGTVSTQGDDSDRQDSDDDRAQSKPGASPYGENPHGRADSEEWEVIKDLVTLSQKHGLQLDSLLKQVDGLIKITDLDKARAETVENQMKDQLQKLSEELALRDARIDDLQDKMHEELRKLNERTKDHEAQVKELQDKSSDHAEHLAEHKNLIAQLKGQVNLASDELIRQRDKFNKFKESVDTTYAAFRDGMARLETQLKALIDQESLSAVSSQSSDEDSKDRQRPRTSHHGNRTSISSSSSYTSDTGERKDQGALQELRDEISKRDANFYKALSELNGYKTQLQNLITNQAENEDDRKNAEQDLIEKINELQKNLDNITGFLVELKEKVERTENLSRRANRGRTYARRARNIEVSYSSTDDESVSDGYTVKSARPAIPRQQSVMDDEGDDGRIILRDQHEEETLGEQNTPVAQEDGQIAIQTDQTQQLWEGAPGQGNQDLAQETEVDGAVVGGNRTPRTPTEVDGPMPMRQLWGVPIPGSIMLQGRSREHYPSDDGQGGMTLQVDGATGGNEYEYSDNFESEGEGERDKQNKNGADTTDGLKKPEPHSSKIDYRRHLEHTNTPVNIADSTPAERQMADEINFLLRDYKKIVDLTSYANSRVTFQPYEKAYISFWVCQAQRTPEVDKMATELKSHMQELYNTKRIYTTLSKLSTVLPTSLSPFYQIGTLNKLKALAKKAGKNISTMRNEDIIRYAFDLYCNQYHGTEKGVIEKISRRTKSHWSHADQELRDTYLISNYYRKHTNKFGHASQNQTELLNSMAGKIFNASHSRDLVHSRDTRAGISRSASFSHLKGVHTVSAGTARLTKEVHSKDVVRTASFSRTLTT